MIQNLPLRSVGKSDLMITPIGLGCWQFSKRKNMAGKFWPEMEDDIITQILKISLEGGINWFDTAEVYGNGASEKALAASLSNLGKKPGEIIIATKWWPMFRTAANILKTIDQRTAAVAPYPIDLYQVHQPWGFSNEKAEMEAMAKLVKDQKIRYVGVSNFSAKQMRNAWEALQKQDIHLVSNQVRYNLLDRKIESNGVLQIAKELGITIIAYSPLAQGLVTGKFHDNPDLLKNIGIRKYASPFKPAGLEKSRPVVKTVQELAKKYSVTPSQIALNWLINSHGETVVAIPGATKESHARENAGTMTFVLSAEDISLLNNKSTLFR
ncbi:MAG: aldo/keto reductase [Bacteroidetes bacterium]|nr:MAG: aldo/keto reductase [Bacteroidota bacterium]